MPPPVMNYTSDEIFLRGIFRGGHLRYTGGMKRIITIQDISCIGKCSITVSLPVLSALGVETAILPTAVLSTHTMFKGSVIRNLEDTIEPFSRHWEDLGFTFDAVYTGYLASPRQVQLVKDFYSRFGGESVLFFVDPAMADSGKLYSGFDDSFPSVMASLCGMADIIVPNVTEACLMTGTDWKETEDEGFYTDLLEKLAALGTKKAAVITGVPMGPGRTGVMGLDIRSGSLTGFSHEKLPVSFHGTGDIFSSVTVGCLMRGFSLYESLETAAHFVEASIRETMLHDPDKTYGVDFEAVLGLLTDRVRNL